MNKRARCKCGMWISFDLEIFKVSHEYPPCKSFQDMVDQLVAVCGPGEEFIELGDVPEEKPTS